MPRCKENDVDLDLLSKFQYLRKSIIFSPYVEIIDFRKSQDSNWFFPLAKSSVS